MPDRDRKPMPYSGSMRPSLMKPRSLTGEQRSSLTSTRPAVHVGRRLRLAPVRIWLLRSIFRDESCTTCDAQRLALEDTRLWGPSAAATR
jgi:hypothetical protein